MLIDWFTVAAQIINFLILVYLLKRFLYGPIINAMEAREGRIRNRLDEARSMTERAASEAEEYRMKSRELEAIRDKLLDEAKSVADKKRKEMLKEARDEVDRIRELWEEEVGRDKAAFLRQLRERAADRIMNICRKALRDMADERLELRVTEAFLARLARLDEGEKREIARIFKGDGKEVVVSTGFDMPHDLKQKIGARVRETLAKNAKVRFIRSDDIICGIELEADGRKVVWSLDAYLSGMEDEIYKVISEKAAPERSR